MAVIATVITQHAEDAAFLWLLRALAVHAPHYTLADLARLDERIEAHLDGLRIAAMEGWALCQEALESFGEAGEAFAAAVLALESGERERIRAVATTACAAPDARRGLVAALGWVEWARVEPWLPRLLAAREPVYRHLGIAACALHRRDPGPALAAAVADADPELRARALRTAGELKRRDLLPELLRRLADEDETCRFWAAWAAALLGHPAALGPLKLFVESGSLHAESALQLAVRALEPARALNWLKGLAQDPAQARIVTMAAGILGDPLCLPGLLKRMAVPALARLAGESFTLITGVDLAYADLEGARPEGFESGPSENPADENVALDPDEDLPWPDPERVAAWWAAHQGEFQAGRRYLLGRPIEPGHLRQVLLTGYQRQRRAAALELALREPAAALFETRAPALRQRMLLGDSPVR